MLLLKIKSFGVFHKFVKNLLEEDQVKNNFEEGEDFSTILLKSSGGRQKENIK